MSFDNQHYISKCLTKPWENRNRELHFFSFSSDKIETERAEKLFAKPNLWPKHFEKIFSNLFEKMVDHLRKSVTSGSGDLYLSGIHWRAVYALLAIHLVRGMHAFEARQESDFSILDKKKFFQVLYLFSQKYQAIRIPCPHQYLAFPESTIYPIPVKVSSEWQIGYALSITPTYAIAYVPYGWSRDAMKKVSQLYLSGLSVGIGTFAPRVVLCPELVASKDKMFLIKKLRESRENAENLIRTMVHKDQEERHNWEIAMDIIWKATDGGKSLRT